jgi:hypothetical protein
MFDLSEDAAVVSLSKRNVLSLLAMLGDGRVLPALASANTYRDGQREPLLLVVVPEPDETHYAGRPAPGPLRPRTEALIRWNEERRDPRENSDA